MAYDTFRALANRPSPYSQNGRTASPNPGTRPTHVPRSSGAPQMPGGIKMWYPMGGNEPTERQPTALDQLGAATLGPGGDLDRLLGAEERNLAARNTYAGAAGMAAQQGADDMLAAGQGADRLLRASDRDLLDLAGGRGPGGYNEQVRDADGILNRFDRDMRGAKDAWGNAISEGNASVGTAAANVKDREARGQEDTAAILSGRNASLTSTEQQIQADSNLTPEQKAELAYENRARDREATANTISQSWTETQNAISSLKNAMAQMQASNAALKAGVGSQRAGAASARGQLAADVNRSKQQIHDSRVALTQARSSMAQARAGLRTGTAAAVAQARAAGYQWNADYMAQNPESPTSYASAIAMMMSAASSPGANNQPAFRTG